MGTDRPQIEYGLSAKLGIAAAVVLSFGGTMFGFAGLLMWSFRAAEVMLPNARMTSDWLTSLFPYATLLNLGLMATITVLGVLNILIVVRAREFLAGGWKRWMIQSMVSVIAAIIFLNATNVS
ncbi:hypothetical protein [uncultured Erythrobacter sp.]|uniref:hypothetical protein n=1 Tax=uncultured Erythrobacter sp. TaxID=263913 RepID=UPI00262864E6|nr:hypothetical protein [uncultured Erythrobacter sp.]